MPDNPNVNRTWASLRIWDEDLIPEQVTERLRIFPSLAYRRGEGYGRGGVWRDGLWSITSQDRLTTMDLEEHIAWLLDQLEPVALEYMEIRRAGAGSDVFCFVEGYGHGGPEFSPRLLKRLADLDLTLGLDIYFAK